MSMLWSNGRQLKSYTKNGETVSYTYDTDGMRLSKTVDGVKYTYLYEGGLLVQETRGSKIFDYSYDANGNIRMLKYRTSPTGSVTYVYYALNSRGDVIGLYNSTGTLFAKYNYDAWGNIISVTNASGVEVSDTHIAKLQPFRYRSYYYDTDSGFYYLQSRYYDPVTHRFINADGLVSTGTGVLGYNMFAYCNNNPVNYSDPSGNNPTAIVSSTLKILAVLVAVVVVAKIVTSEPVKNAVANVVQTTIENTKNQLDAIGNTVGVIASIVNFSIENARARSHEKELAKSKRKSFEPSTVIYRYGGKSPGNLTPREKDRYSGLSFSTEPNPGAAMTTIEALNATGVVYAVQDGPTHVSVRPVGASMDDWINGGSNSIWTQTIRSMVIRWDGGY